MSLEYAKSELQLVNEHITLLNNLIQKHQQTKNQIIEKINKQIARKEKINNIKAWNHKASNQIYKFNN